MAIIVDITKGIEGYEDKIDLTAIKDFIVTLLEDEYNSNRDIYLSLLLTGNENIQIINRDYRNKDIETDVISFAYRDSEDFLEGPIETLGDIIISLERVKSQAKEYGHSFEREFYYVLTHGLLHLLGYDHISEEDKKIMRAKEEEILERNGYVRT
ncbi:putative rRNA maturation factor [Hypnocyclicus thermotrophus]|uniref:Endoribonuclease YbeY n=1 Tax=Hypnocyclicus thermotrophus TaxID=1627895 RepID=A0AA46I612_9FUSO|nr:rRNA maturation RNase YbeY [Hypnocyclicus thermotrophus]TDT71863.1 putative rRNA maturation factor [Hypnocyclicus thermotrophus]